MGKFRPEGWQITLGLSALAVVAALLVPSLLPSSSSPEPELGADVCVRLGPYECCYDENRDSVP